jgi:hypothetical protein
MPTVKNVLQKYHEGQRIFRRESVACLVARIEQLEKYTASQPLRAADVLEWCGCKGYTPTMESGKCSVCRKNAHR